MKIIRVKNWDDNFENNRSRETKNLAWVPFPNKQDGDGYTILVDHKNGASHLGCWVAIVQVASKCGVRGTLLRDNGKPHDTVSLSRMTRLSEKLISETIKRLLDDEIGWLEVIDGEGLVQDVAEGCGDVAGKRLEQKRTEGKEKKGKERAEYTEAFEEFWSAYPKRLNKRKAFQSWTEGCKQTNEANIIKGASNYAEYCKVEKTEDKFIKHPTTWLNQGCWEDEYNTTPNAPTRTVNPSHEFDRVLNAIIIDAGRATDKAGFWRTAMDKYKDQPKYNGFHVVDIARKQAQ